MWEEEGEDGEGKEVWKRKRMKKIFTRFDYHTFMIHVALFRMLTCSATHAHFGGLGHRGDGVRDQSRYSRLQLRWFRVPVFQYTLGWSKKPADHPEVYRGPMARKPSYLQSRVE